MLVDYCGVNPIPGKLSCQEMLTLIDPLWKVVSAKSGWGKNLLRGLGPRPKRYSKFKIPRIQDSGSSVVCQGNGMAASTPIARMNPDTGGPSRISLPGKGLRSPFHSPVTRPNHLHLEYRMWN